MAAIKTHLMEVCRLFGAEEFWEDEDDMENAANLAQIVWDLDDHAQDYGKRAVVDADAGVIRFVDETPAQTASAAMLRPGTARLQL